MQAVLFANRLQFTICGSRARRFSLDSRIVDRTESRPKVFRDGNVSEWLQRFELCASVNKWNEAKAERLATYLDGDALAVYLELQEEDKKDYEKVKTALLDAFHPVTESFSVMKAFQGRKLQTSETPRMFLYELKKLLQHTLVKDPDSQESLIFHQFIAGLLESVAWQIRSDPNVKTSAEALKCAQLLLMKEKEIPVQVVNEKSSKLLQLELKVNSLQKSLQEIARSLKEGAAVDNVASIRYNRNRG